jgi:hypothetical protein
MSVEAKEFFRGEPQPESEFGHRMLRYPWAAILAAIKPGTGQEVIMVFQTCKKAITQLERQGKIKKGEYRVSTKRASGGSGKERVFIVRKDMKKTS